MLVKMQWPKPLGCGARYERIVDCDVVNKFSTENGIELSFYRDGKMVENPKFNEPVSIFITDRGKTVERIDFKVNEK